MSNAIARTTCSRRTAALSFVAVAAGAMSLVGGVGANPAAATVQGVYLANTPGISTWTVPAGATTAEFQLAGAAGGNVNGSAGFPGGGGLGGYVTAVLPVTAGDVYTIVVGGAGGQGGGSFGGQGGTNGGGHGGTPGLQFPPAAGSGGGGASDVRLGGDDFGHRVLVAGGGGGAGAASSNAAYGGAGGGLVGGNGTIDTPVPAGGTQTSGGQRGGDPLTAAGGGTSGVFGAGGDGGTRLHVYGGGGGGGGWNGGGGSQGGNGGGGSSFVSPQATSVSNLSGAHAGNGFVHIKYGTSDAAAFVLGSTPSGGVGEPYSYLFATTGSPAPTVTTTSPLPAGLALAAGGTLSGTPTAAGTYPLTLVASNGLGNPASYNVSVTVLALPKVSIAASTITEPSLGTGALVFPVALSRVSTVPVSVHWATKNGTAIAGSDYIAASGTLTVSPGSTLASVAVVIRSDSVSEANETFTVSLTAPSHAKLGTAKATGTIAKPVNP
jgi:Glycine rich protein/Calx-beta domain